MSKSCNANKKIPFLSLSGRITFLLFTGFILSLFLFAGLRYISNDLLGEYFQTSDYISRSEAPYIENLEKYVQVERVAASDAERLGEWRQTNHVQYLMVSRNRKLIYDSLYGGSLQTDQAKSDRIHWNWQHFYTVEFSDGDADVFIYDHFEERFAMLVTSLEVFLCAFLWLFFVFLNLRKDIQFILTLNEKVSAFGRGENVTFAAPDRNDELGMLSEGLGNMSEELLERKEQEQLLQQSRNNLLIGLAHDLRTPLTTLIAELELAEKQSTRSIVNQPHIKKAHQKALHIRDLANQLFESFQIQTAKEIPMEAPAYVEYALGEPFSILYEELSTDGFDMQTECLEWRPVRVRICIDYMDRIINNLTSNIRQYARRDKPVTLCLIYDDTYIHIYLVNERSSVEATMMEPAHRHGIGVQNITRMMHKMGGKCDVQIKNEFYSVRLSFPFCEQ